MSEPVIVVCEAGALPCGRVGPPSPEREAAVRAQLDAARALLEPAGLGSSPSGAPLIVLDARLDGVAALSARDAASEGLMPYAGRPAIFFGEGVFAETNPDVLLHELTHVWMRTHGADDARWRLEDARANHESALVQEAVADFVAATLTQDPVIGEGLALVPAYSLRVVATCPEGLTGFAHADAVIVSGALWELAGVTATAQGPPSRDDVSLITVVESALAGGKSVQTFVDHLALTLAARSPTLATRWAEIVDQRALRQCHTPIAIGQTRASARAGEFLAAGTRRFGVAEVTGPLHFSAALNGTKTARLRVRSSQRGALAIDWRARDPDGAVLEEGRAALEGWPSQFATVSLSKPSHSLTFAFVTSQGHDVTFNDVAVTPLEAHLATTHSAPPPHLPRSGCAAGVPLWAPLDLALPLLLGWLMRRRARR